QYAGNLNGYNEVQNVRNQVAQNPRVQNVGNQNGLIGVQGNGIQNQIGNDLDEIEEVNANCILMANLQQASSSGTQTDSAPVYDSDGSAEVHESYDNNEIFNMFTQEEQYTELLEPIPEPQQVPQTNNNVISEVTDVEQDGETVEQHFANFEQTRALYESLYQNLAVEVEKVNSVNRKLKETNADLTTELARYKNQKRCFEISQEKYDKLERCYQKSVYQEQCLSKKINALHLSTFHVQTDDELSDKDLKQIEADDQAIQTILLGLPEDIYAAVDSCETTREIRLRVQQMMKGSDIGIQEKKAKLFNEWERFTSNEWESIESYYHRFLKLMNDLKRNKHFPEKIAKEQYTELLEPIPESHQVPQNDNDVISEVTSVEQSGDTIEQHPANFEETRALYESLYQNLAIEVEKVNSVNHKLKETNADLTTELARFKNQT
nr:hypothetical protein [Tanacetum cinerariifolium]